jgi:hypothetical protein
VFLGFVVFSEEVKMDPKNIEAILAISSNSS